MGSSAAQGSGKLEAAYLMLHLALSSSAPQGLNGRTSPLTFSQSPLAYSGQQLAIDTCIIQLTSDSFQRVFGVGSIAQDRSALMFTRLDQAEQDFSGSCKGNPNHTAIPHVVWKGTVCLIIMFHTVVMSFPTMQVVPWYLQNTSSICAHL